MKSNGGSPLPSRKTRDKPWWFSPSVFNIIPTEKTIRRCQLHPLLIQKILTTMAGARFPTRPKRAKMNWLEPVCVDGAMYQLSCHIDRNEKIIVVTNIRVPKKMRKPKKRKPYRR